MCGRFVQFTPLGRVADHLRSVLDVPEVLIVGADPADPAAEPRWSRPAFNIPPTAQVPIVRMMSRSDGARPVPAIGPARWGFPSWKSASGGGGATRGGARGAGGSGSSGGGTSASVLFNARGETVWTKPSFAQGTPCLIVMDAWYEWLRDAGSATRTPWITARRDGDPLLAAGLAMVVPGQAEAPPMVATTMITTAAHPDLEWLHHRMPRLLTGAEAQAWMAGEELGALAAQTYAEVDALLTVEAHPSVGSVSNRGPEMMEQLAARAGSASARE